MMEDYDVIHECIDRLAQQLARLPENLRVEMVNIVDRLKQLEIVMHGDMTVAGEQSSKAAAVNVASPAFPVSRSPPCETAGPQATWTKPSHTCPVRLENRVVPSLRYISTPIARSSLASHNETTGLDSRLQLTTDASIGPQQRRPSTHPCLPEHEKNRSRKQRASFRRDKKRKYQQPVDEHDVTKFLADVADAFGTDSDSEILQETFEHLTADPISSEAAWLPSSWILDRLLTKNPIDSIKLIEALPGLVREIDDHIISQRLSRVWKRMMLAQFYSTYKLAQNQPPMFLQWTEEIAREKSIDLTRTSGRRDTQVKSRFIDIIFWQSRKTRVQAANKVNDWQRSGRPWAELIQRFGCGSLLLVPDQLTDESVRYLSHEKFFLLLDAIQERSDLFAHALTKANEKMTAMASNFQIGRGSSETDSGRRISKPASAALPDPTDPSLGGYLRDTLNPQILTVHQLNSSSAVTNNEHVTTDHNLFGHPPPRGTAARDLSNSIPHAEEMGTLDAARSTGPDDGCRQAERIPSSEDFSTEVLDQLFRGLNGRPQVDVEDWRLEFHVWPSIRLVDTTLDDDTATWSPQLCSTFLNNARYQVLPYFASYHWQLAVFDQINHVIARYDSAWQDGYDRFTFSVLQNWLHSSGGNPFDRPYEYNMIKSTPVPDNAHNTGIVVWWVAKQLMCGKDLSEPPADWEHERSSAMQSLRQDDDFDLFVDY
ncbi:hypothetical protein LTR48_003002 [Friedmanniomyces endolithicus]|uniref:Ubiquitin-like protease family profile domain-containing protein n=1 Tax=Rachicladosporium monterosium TaxID=1507873 RepID=A0ABR0L9S2_9PEZI|nr:hypothetical protein LTR48_003002 [Friedmanniomyces endolithicus]KAK5145655.1 hypothetical protein LTR32_002628 [Rachicladosporium monterosium]